MSMKSLNPFWIVGFTDGEGCFHIGIAKNKSHTTGYQVLLEFVLVQHVRDVQLLHKIKDYFDCGVVRASHGNCMAYRVRDQKHLAEIIIPFFEKHELCTKKKLDFLKFRKVMSMVTKNEHITEASLEKIKNIKKALEDLSVAPEEA